MRAKKNEVATPLPQNLGDCSSRDETLTLRLLAGLLYYPSRRVPRILVYHRFGDNPRSISARGFERQLQFLKERYNVIHLSRLIAALRGRETVPPHGVVLTVDDGYADFYRVAFPLLRRYELPCTFFVTTGFIEGRMWIWVDKLAWLLAHRDRYPDLHIVDRVVRGGNRIDAPRLWSEILALLRASDADRAECQLSELARQLVLELPERPVAEYEACSWKQLREMEATGFVEVGGHTRTHHILSRLDPAKLPDEIDGCLEDLNANLGERPRSFCYPNGQPADYNKIVRQAVVRSGFTCACTAFYDGQHLEDPYALRRFSSSGDFAQFYKAASALQYWGASLLGRNNINYAD